MLLASASLLTLATSAPAAASVTIDSPTAGSSMQNRTPAFSGTGVLLLPITLSIHEGGPKGALAEEAVTVFTDGAGQWQATPAASLADGPYTAVAEQGEGLETATSEAAFTIDNAAPNVTMAAVQTPTKDATPTLKGTRGTEAGDKAAVEVTIRNSEGFVADQGSATITGGTWSYVPAHLEDGTYTAQATQEDAAENVGKSEPIRTFTVDTVPPLVTMNAVPSPSKDATPTLTGSAGEALGEGPVKVTIYKGTAVGGPEAASGTSNVVGGLWTYTSSHLEDGTYTAQATQEDAAENLGKSEPARTFTIHTQAPLVTMNAVASPSNDATPTLTGGGGEAAGDGPVKVTIYLGTAVGGPEAASGTSTVVAGAWSYTPPQLNDGTYTAEATQEDSAGNVGESKPARTFTIDTHKPLVSVNALSTPSKDATPTLTGGGGEAPGDDPTVRVTIYKGAAVGGPEAASATPTIVGGAWTYTSGHLADGTYTAQAIQEDAAGNAGESVAVTFTIDTLGPSLTMDSVPSPRNNSSPVLQGSRGAAEGDAPEVAVAIYKGSTAEGKPDVSGSATVGPSSWSYATSGLPDGTYTAQASQQDSAGNTTTATRTFTIDTTGPAVSLSTPAEGAFLGSAQPTFAGGAGNASGDSPNVTVSIYPGSSPTGTPLTKSVARSGASWSWAPNASELELTDGTYTVQASQTDSAGNSATSAAHTFTVKTTGPAVTLNPVASPTPDSTPSFSGGSGTEPADVQTVTLKVYSGGAVSSNPLRTLVVPAGGGSWSAGPVETLPDGSYTAQAEQKDKAGNTGKSASVTFTIDTTKPKIQVGAVPSPTNDTTPTLEGARGTEAGDQASVSVTIHEGASIAGKVVSSQSFGVTGSSWSYTTQQLGDGTYTAQVTQEDAAGNTGEATVTFTVDSVSPHVTLSPVPTPSNDSTPKLQGAAGSEPGDLQTVKVTIYEGTAASGTEAASATVSVSGGKWSYTSPQLKDGTYTALATQSDKAGNAGYSGSRTFTINTAAPKVTLSSPALVSNNTTPSFSGTATDTTPVTVKIFPGTATSGPTVWEATASVASESWGPVAVSPPLADGQYTVLASQPSSLGNPEGKSPAVTFKVNTKAPSVTLGQPTSPSNNTAPTFTGTGSDPSGAVTVKIYEGEQPTGTVVAEATASGTGGSWTSSPASPALKKEKHVYTATATQKSSLGNPEGVSAPVTFVVDTNPPTVTLNAPKSPSNNPTPSFTGTASDTSTVTVEIHEGPVTGTVVATATAPGASAWTSGAANQALKSGQYTAVAVQPSSIGNLAGKSSPVTFTIDTKPPAVTLAGPPSPTNNSKVTLGGRPGTESGDAPLIGVTVYRGTLPGGEVVLTGSTTPKEGAWSFTSSSLEDGTYTARANQVDSAENLGSSAPVTFTVDTQPPTLTLTAPPKKSNSRSPAFAGTASEKTPVTVRIYEGETSTSPIREVKATGTGGEWQSPPTSPELPAKKTLYTATATQTDAAGNTTTTPRASFIVDGEAPSVALNQPRTPSNNSAPAFTGTASDTTPVAVLIYAGTSAGGSPVSKATATGTGAAWKSGPASPSLPDGQYTAVAVQQSAVGNHEGQTPPVSFAVDTVAPVVTLASPRTGSSFVGDSLRAEGGADVGQGALPGVTVQLFSGGSIAPGQAPGASVEVNSVSGRWAAAFAGLAAGTYTIRALQADDAGNVGVSASATLTLSAPVTSAPPRPAPTASFTWFPPAPHVGEHVSLVSNSGDPGSPLTSYGWDLAGNGPFQPGGQVLSTAFATAGNHVVRLRVGDAAGLTSVVAQTIPVAPVTVSLMQPFPIVRVVTSRTSTGVRLRLLSVLASVGARVSVSCRGHGCPARSASRIASSGRAGVASLEFRRFQRPLRAGLVLEIRVYQAGLVGKYTKLTIRRGGPPRRFDACLNPGGVTPMPCPAS